ncbi:thiol reductant ABC exporter subunit CydD [Polycladomyces abyssicola]|uniref:Thiol reductant ABC exporter subunit CydD n=1 Tax=Polycladomyces abyssicola TaxID=1125966 RepID=A0A8D5ZPW9_9BACL|nr:thiol reductant ABC exporter subunit CydD [Polycladomyces abyssicola]BCU82758.1 thiol reductant ABC exporter subunit CydD [Polycladomyces abyssicola]
MKEIRIHIKQLVRQIPMVRVLLAVTVGVGLTSGVLLILQAYYLARVVNAVFLEHAPLHQVSPWLWILFGLIITRGVLTWLDQAVAAHLAVRVKTDLRRRLIAHLLRLGPVWSAQEQRGELVNTAMTGIEQLESFLSRYLPQMALSALMPLAIFGFVLTRDSLTAFILAVAAPLIVFFMILIGKAAESASSRQWQQLSLLAARFLDVLEGLTTLKIFGRSKARAEWMGRASEAYRLATMRTLRVAFLSSFLLELFATLSTAVVAVTLGLRLVADRMPFFTAFLILLLTPEFFQPLRALGSEFHAGLNGVTAAGRIFEILEAKSPGLVQDGWKIQKDMRVSCASYNDIHRDLQPKQGAKREPWIPTHHGSRNEPFTIDFVDVTFSYDPGLPPILHDINLTVRPGETLALVGPSGAGKSTLLDLLQGFLRPTAGEILINGQALSDWPIDEWRRRMAVLRQHTHIFAGTVMDNLRLARPNASMEEVISAARTAKAHDWIVSLPQGYNTPLGEGGYGLSGGQIQRLAVARALLKDAPLVLLDEPTAHLDPETESSMQEGITRLLAGRTVIVVAHRLSTVNRANRIIVMEDGKIVEQGSQSELMAVQGMYRRLRTAYAGGEEA